MATWIKPMEWQNEGIEPNESLKQTGYKVEDKPAAGTFNYFFNNYYKCITELQNDAQAPKGVGKSLAGKEVKPTYDTTVTAEVGAEIFNDFAERTYIGSDPITGNVASKEYSHAEGFNTTTAGNGGLSHVEGNGTKTSEYRSHAEGFNTTARGGTSHAQNNGTTASGNYSHAEGVNTWAIGRTAHAEGEGTTARGEASHAEGYYTEVNGNYSHAQNYSTWASGTASHAGGYNANAVGNYSFAHGYKLNATDFCSVFGVYNKDPEVATLDGATGDVMLIGGGYVNGTTAVKNAAFRVNKNGKCYGGTAFYINAGVDYAEYFEWLDGNPNNEDRRGLFVTLEGNKIKPANKGEEYILGVVSAEPVIIGNNYDDTWQGMYLKDIFGAPLTEDVETEEGTEKRYIINPEYDHTKPYMSREQRPEWGLIGTHGQLVVIDDGTCQVDGYCTVSDGGTATASTEPTDFKVLERLDETHVRVFVM